MDTLITDEMYETIAERSEEEWFVLFAQIVVGQRIANDA